MSNSKLEAIVVVLTASLMTVLSGGCSKNLTVPESKMKAEIIGEPNLVCTVYQITPNNLLLMVHRKSSSEVKGYNIDLRNKTIGVANIRYFKAVPEKKCTIVNNVIEDDDFFLSQLRADFFDKGDYFEIFVIGMENEEYIPKRGEDCNESNRCKFAEEEPIFRKQLLLKKVI